MSDVVQQPVAQVAQPTVVQMPQQPRERLSTKERAKRDAEEAEAIVSQYFVNGVYTFPTTGFQVPIQVVPEAAYQRFFMQGDLPRLPDIPTKSVKGRKGKDIDIPDYENEGYQAAVAAYNSHNANIRQQQAGNMIRYIYGRGTSFEIPNDWLEDYEAGLADDEEVSTHELKYAFLCDQAHTNAELKALTISICGRDPLGSNVDDEDDEDES